MNKILWSLVIVISSFLVSLIYLNRAHAKIQEAIIVAITGLIAVVLGVIFFSAENEEIHKDISVVYFVSLEKKEPVFFTTPVLLHYLMQSGVIWGNYKSKEPKNSKLIFSGIPDSSKALIDLQTAAFLQHLSMFYRDDWNMQIIKKELPGFSFTRFRCLGSYSKDKQIFTKASLETTFSKNIFFKSLMDNLQITLPRGTKVIFYPYDSKQNICRIRMVKRFSFDTEITFSFSSYSSGLGKIGSYAGLTLPTNKWYVSWDNQDKFGTVVLNVLCKAKFFKLKSGNPNVLKYRELFRNLFDDLYQTYDWAVCDRAMRDYYEELANLNIVKSLGSGFEQKPIIESGSIKQVATEKEEDRK